jgi:hypothetical protein
MVPSVAKPYDDKRTDTQSLVLRRGGTVVLNDDWKAGWLVSLPVLGREISTSNSSAPNREFGIGDVFLQGNLVEKLDERAKRLKRTEGATRQKAARCSFLLLGHRPQSANMLRGPGASFRLPS